MTHNAIYVRVYGHAGNALARHHVSQHALQDSNSDLAGLEAAVLPLHQGR